MRRLVVLLAVVLGLTMLAAVPSATADPTPGECEALSSADLRYPAPRITGTTPPGKDAFDCYVLPDPPGTVYSQRLSGAQRMDIADATGAQVCGSVGPCRLIGTPPFRMRIYGAYDRGLNYKVQLVRLTGDSGCPQHAMTTFGSDDDVFATPSTGDLAVACWSIDLDEGGTLMVPAGVRFDAYDANGEHFCDQYELYEWAYFCEMPTGGQGTFIAGMGVPGTSYSFSALASHRTEGCAADLSTSWAAPALELPTRPRIIHCRGISAAAGERLLPGAQLRSGEADYFVIDARGRAACPRSGVEFRGCVTEGVPPYRFVTWPGYVPSESPDTYTAAVRSLDDVSACPRVEMLPWGTPPSDLHPGIGCRRFRLEAGQSLRAASIIVGGLEPVHMRHDVVDATGRIVCNSIPLESDWDAETPISCRDLAPGDYVLVTDAVPWRGYVTSIYDTKSHEGCEPPLPGLTAVDKAVAPGQIDCYRVTPPVDGRLWFDHPGTEHNGDGTLGQLLAPDGTSADRCDSGGGTWCVPAVGAYRLIVGLAEDTHHRFAIHTLSDLAGCVDIRLGRTELDLSQDAVTCIRVHDLERPVDLEMSTDNVAEGGFHLGFAVGTDGYCDFDSMIFQPEQDVRCYRHEAAPPAAPGTAYSILFGTGADQRVTIDRLPNITRNHEPPRILGRARVGRTVRVDAGTWSPRPVAYFYRWFVGQKRIKGADTARLPLRARYAGRKVRVQVFASLPGLAMGTAVSRPVTVRR